MPFFTKDQPRQHTWTLIVGWGDERGPTGTRDEVVMCSHCGTIAHFCFVRGEMSVNYPTYSAPKVGVNVRAEPLCVTMPRPK